MFENGQNSSAGNVLYVDGVRQTLSQQAWNNSGYRSATDYIQLSGWNAGPGYEFDGILDDVLIYNRGLTDAEVLSIYRGVGSTEAVPEPSAFALFGLGAALAGFAARRRRKAA